MSEEKENRKPEEMKTKVNRKNIKINSLDLVSLKKENIPDYYDEFMSKANEFSNSWTDLLVLEKRHG